MTARRGTYGRTQAVGVTIPAHNEGKRLAGALHSLKNACAQLEGWGGTLRVAIVLDACRDDSETIAHKWRRDVERQYVTGVDILTCEFENVGRARALGCDVLLGSFSDIRPSRIWLATSDADSRVPRGWLIAQMSQRKRGVDAWVGRVSVGDWSPHRSDTAIRWQREYDGECRPIHGANLGFAADQYLAVGGFRAIPTGEDRDLVAALWSVGATVHFDSVTKVATSSRRHARAPEGFASALQFLDTSTSGVP